MNTNKSLIPLSQQFYDIATKDVGNKKFKLTFANNQKDIQSNYFIAEESKSYEVVCFKKTLLQTFKEAHDYIESFDCKISNLPLNINLVFCTSALLLSTPENKSILNLHEKLLLQCVNRKIVIDIDCYLQKEVYLIERLLTSSNNRLNKSSSLWTFYKKLFNLVKSRKLGATFNYGETLMSSASIHFSNYYSWNAAKWFYDEITLAEKKILFTKISAFCHQNVSDCSAWTCLSRILSRKNFELNSHKDYHLSRTNNISEIDMTQDVLTSNLSFDLGNVCKELIDLIDKCEIYEWPPFLCLLEVFYSFPDVLHQVDIFEKWSSEYKSFEHIHGPIILNDGHMNNLENLESDVLLLTKTKHLSQKKKFILAVK